ncbi:MAG: CHASE2 domain-containing protein [Cyanobacteria bacterium J06627_28]
MNKRVTLKLTDGSLQTGFAVVLQMGDEGSTAAVELSGRLPAAPKLQALYHQWQAAYRNLGLPSRIEMSRAGFATNVSLVGDCDQLAQQLRQAFNQWLQADDFRPVQDKLLERLQPADIVRFMLQTSEESVQRLPWHLWTICDRYPNLEIALSAPTYEKLTAPADKQREKVRILAVLGHSQGLDIEIDKALLNRLPEAEITFLVEPTRQALDEQLWAPAGWDILFFAGHSATESTGAKSPTSASVDPCLSAGHLYINPTETLTIPQLKNALKKALSRGLKIAIFNSCDGLGLAQSLSDLQISQILVMRELVPDAIAHSFLKSFLEAFSRGESFYLAVREAREKLQAQEEKFPCAAWLPTIYQNPAEPAPTWSALLGRSDVAPSASIPLSPSAVVPQPRTAVMAPWPRLLMVHGLVVAMLLLVRSLGLFQGWELKAFDVLMRSRPAERPDPRLVIITVTDADIKAQDPEDRRGSLGDGDLAKVLSRLDEMQPRIIGLDIYRDFPARENQPALAQDLANKENLFVVCKSRDSEANSDDISPPPEVPGNRVGFSDYVSDPDGRIRRQLLTLTPEPASSCASEYGLSTLLALAYLSEEGVEIGVSDEGDLQVGELALAQLTPNDGGYVGVDAGGRQLLLNYRSLARPEKIAETITLGEFLNGEIAADVMRDRIVLIGTTATGFRDQWFTPYSPVAGETKGVFMQAQMVSHLISAVLDERPLLASWPDWAESLWIIAWAGVGSLLIVTLGRDRHHFLSKLALGLIMGEIALFGLCWLLLAKDHRWVPWVPAAIAPIAVAASTLPTNRFLAATHTDSP